MTVAVLQMPNWGSSMSPPRPQKQVKIAKGGLATLAPRYRAWIDEAFDTAETTPNKTVNLPRARLPPRSRFGCWTCRTRKVKCDEARPECTPCSRLGHHCDYNPRLSFKDDTRRVVEKMSGRAGAPGPVWNPHLAKRRRLNSPHDDLLPPFASLTNDEDRERKAEFRKPGTYHVIANPATFADCDEYRDKGDDEVRFDTTLSRYRSNSRPTTDNPGASIPFQSTGRMTSSTPMTNDPDIVVLKVFEDDSRRVTPSPSGLCMIRSRSSRASTFSNSSTLSIPASIAVAHQHRSPSMYAYDDSPLMRMANPEGQDHRIIYFYKSFVQRHLLQVHRDTLGTPLETNSVSSADVFERQAATFLPLYHALMAFCALSMSQKQGNTQSLYATALQHYQQALPSLQASLRTESDLASDGVFLTHFILLLYEIAAGEAYGMSLWQQHISQLLRIILLRRNMYGREPYSFILWWVANIDTHAVLSGMGNGRFVETMLQHNLLPSGLEADDYHQPATSISAATPTHSGIPDPLFSNLPSALAFHRRICTLAAQLGLLARDLRAEEQSDPNSRNPAAFTARRQRVTDFQSLLRRTWDAQIPMALSGGYSNLVLPVGVRGLYEHSFALHRALTIYAHTSLPHSCLSTSSSSPSSSSSKASAFAHSEIRAASNDIILLAREIVSSAHYERKFIVFPLFMAGCVAASAREKAEVRSLLRWLEEDSVGRNGVAARELLEELYARQEEEEGVVMVVRGEGERRTERRGGEGGGLGLALGLDLGLDLDLGLGLGMGAVGDASWTQPQHQYQNQRHQSWASSGAGADTTRRESKSGNNEHHRQREQKANTKDQQVKMEQGTGGAGAGIVHVDWVRLMRELGLQIVNCRL